MPDRHGAERLGQTARENAPHLERIADARGHFGVVGQHVPAPVTQPHQIDGIVGEVASRRLAVGDLHGPQEMLVGMYQHRRQHALLEEELRAVEIAEHGIEQLGALHEACLEGRPFVRRDHEGQRIEGPAGRGAVVEQVDGGAQLLELAARALDTFTQPAGKRADDAQNALPVIADRLLARDQFVIRACRRRSEAAQRLHGPVEEY